MARQECACVALDAHECMRQRYAPKYTAHDEQCECACHDDTDDLDDQDFYGDPDPEEE